MNTTRNSPKDVIELLNFALSAIRPLNEKVNVTTIAINKVNWLNNIIGVITPYCPTDAAILISSSPVIKTKKRNITPKTPRAIHPILANLFMSNYFFAERMSINVIEASSISLTIESILATI